MSSKVQFLYYSFLYLFYVDHLSFVISICSQLLTLTLALILTLTSSNELIWGQVDCHKSLGLFYQFCTFLCKSSLHLYCKK